MDKKLKSHPGEAIHEEMLARNQTPSKLAKLAGVERAYLMDVIIGKKPINERLADGLCEAWGVSSYFWLALQNLYDKEESI